MIAFGSANNAEGQIITNLSFTLNPSGDNRLLVVGISYYDATGTAGTVSFAGANLTRHIRQAGGGESSELWYLVAPATGLGTVTINFSASMTDVVAGGHYWTGVDQSTPLDTGTSSSGANTDPSLTVASAADDVVVDNLYHFDTTFMELPDVGALQTQRWSRIGLDDAGGASSSEPGAASVTMSWTFSINPDSWRQVAMSINPAAEVTPTTASFMNLMGVGN